MSASRRGVLDHEVLTGGSGNRPLRHLDVATHAVPVVHDEVAGAQLQRVDLSATPGGHGPHVLRRRALAEQVRLGEEHQTDLRRDEPVIEAAGGDCYDVRRRFPRQIFDESGGQVVLGEHLPKPLRGTVALGQQHEPEAGREPLPDIVQRAFGVSAVRVGGTHRQRPRLDGTRLDVNVDADDLTGLRAQRLSLLGWHLKTER